MTFSRELHKSNQPKIYFNNAHLGIYLGKSLNFSYHISEQMSNAMKGIGIIRKINKALPQHSVRTLCK